MGLTDIKKELKKLDKNHLVDVIADLYKKNKAVQEYLDFYVNPDEKELFKKYKEKVRLAFYPKKEHDLLKLKDGKTAISDFKKMGGSPDLVADLMLYYVEMGVVFTNDYGDIDEPFYDSIAGTYSRALVLMEKENILERFKDRATKVVDDTSNIGWGFHDELGRVWLEFYGE